MKNLDWKHFLLAGIIIILLFFRGCVGEKTETKITIKDKPIKIEEVNGSIPLPTNQDEIPVAEPDTIFLGEPIYLPSPLSESLLEDLKLSKDSLSRYKLLAEAARKREYSSDFEDDLVKINVHTTVFGKLDKNDIKYTLKERTVIVPETITETVTTKTDNFGLLITAGYRHPLDNTAKSVIEAGAGIRVKNISVVGTVNTQKQVGANLIIEF